MLNKRALLVAVFCSLVFASGPFLHGQATGSFSGTVSDKAGAVVSGATVKVSSQDTGLSREATTDDSGHYLIPLLPVAQFTIRVTSQGFQTTEQKDVRLQVDEHRELDFSLAPASVNTSVEVSTTEVAVETANPTLGQVITSEQVADLPLNGRNFVQLATLTPGTTSSTSPVSFFTSAASSEAATRGSFSLSSGGSREQETDWLLDGNDNNQLDEGGIAIFSEIDDIQEFKVLTYNYSAEYGERAGPTVLVTTKSGSNQWHGSLFEFFRNTKLDATRFFFTSKQQFNLNQFGGSLGGPIKRDKTFFFLDYQAKMQREGVPFTGFVPTTGMTTPFDAAGDYDFSSDPLGVTPTNPYAGGTSFLCVPGTKTPEPVLADGSQTPGLGQACATIPGALVNPIGARVALLYPTPNANPAGGFNYENQPVRKLNEGTWDVRLDHNFSSKDSAFARFSYDQATNFVPGGSPTWSEANAFGSNQHIENHGRNAVITETHVFSPNLINQATVGYNRIFNHILSFGTGTCEAAKLGIPGADLASQCDGITGYPASLNQASQECVSCGLTSFDMSAYFSIGDRGFAPYQGGTNVYSLSDTLDVVHGKHEIRAGLGFRAEQMNIRNNAFQDGFVVNVGSATGDNIADLLLGSMGVFAAHDQTFLGATTGRRWKLFRPFVQDNWRVTPNLTVNLGFAWALATPVTEEANRQANFDVASLKWFVPANSPGISGCTVCVPTNGAVGIQFDKTALEPRIGFAWKPMGSEKTAIRGGYGIVHDSAWNQGGQGLWQNPPYYAEVDTGGLCATPTSTGCGLSNGFLVAAGTPSSTPVAGGAVLSSPVNPLLYTGTIQSENRNLKQGVIQQFNLNVERQLPGNVVLTVGYGGSRSAHILVGQFNENLNDPSACPNGANPVAGYTLGCGFGFFPYTVNQPGGGIFQSVDINNSIGAARYDSLQVKAETKSMRHGLYALIGYTYSRNFDTGLTDGLGTNPGALYYPLPGTAKLDWGLSQLNLNNSFTASVLYDLPFGKGKKYGSSWSGATNAVLGHWQVNVIERATSGFPLFVVDSGGEAGVDFSYNGDSFQRPNLVGDPNRAGDEGGNTGCPTRIHTLQNWFNPCAFAKAPAGELGTAPRAPVYGPRFVNTDFSVIKNFPFREGMGLQFRAEFFNLLNHAQFFLNGFADTGQQDINTPSSFGVVNNTVNNPRLIQFALRFNF
ncbi:MAG TPA: carboxypeptidase-like regulatory domain-containing protein [Candidatus Acidoferrales bacterium]|nr:carboxypeptidase-like regulatory domain-containing protein [Candidatus Acidoferrales bacterium]